MAASLTSSGLGNFSKRYVISIPNYKIKKCMSFELYSTNIEVRPFLMEYFIIQAKYAIRIWISL